MEVANPKVDWYFEKKGPWQSSLVELRRLALGHNLLEELKWGCPCYSLQNDKIVLIHAFKEYCALLFFKGALLADVEKLLTQQTDNVQAARQMRFGHLDEILNKEAYINIYIKEAIEKAHIKFELKPTKEFAMAEEFAEALHTIDGLQTAFDALTPGRQRGYLLYFAAAKQAKTRMDRVAKFVPAILAGKGLED